MALGVLLALVALPWQGLTDAAGSVLPASASSNFDAATVNLLLNGLWWRVEPDYSSFLVLHQAFAEGGGEGDRVFTFGPWGFLYRGYHPETFGAQLAGWALLVCAAAMALWHVAVWSFASTKGRLVWALAVVVLLSPAPRESLLLLLPYFLSVACFGIRDHRSTPLSSALAMACALAGLVKLSALVLGMTVVLVITVHDLMRRKVPLVLGAYAASIVAFWLVAGEKLNALPGFLSNALEVLRGYTDGSSLAVDGVQPELLIILAVVVSLIAFSAALELRSSGANGVLPLATLAATLLSGLKAGFVRGDRFHVSTALVTVSVVAVLVVAKEAWRARERAPLFASVSVLAAVAILSPHLGALSEIGPQSLAVLRLPSIKRESDRRYIAELAAIRGRNPVYLSGPVDIYPHRQSIVLANGLDYHPRPVFQSYIAWTAALADKNAAHLRYAQAPKWLLFEVRPVDGRLSALEDGLSWPEIMRRYDVIAARASILTLRLRREPRSIRTGPSSVVHGVAFGERVPVPPHESMMWASFHLQSTAVGNLASLLYRSPLTFVTLEFSDGTTRRQRLIPRLGAEGFLLSPHVIDSRSFAALLGGDRELRDAYSVVAVRITAESKRAALFFREPFTVEFRGIETAEVQARVRRPGR